MRAAFLIVLTVIVGSHARAQEDTASPDEALRQHQRLAQQMIQSDIVPRLWGALSAQERRALESTSVAAVFDRNPYRIGVASAKGGTSTIELGAAFLQSTDVASDATAVAIHLSRFPDLVGFTRRYVGALRAAWQTPLDVPTTIPTRAFADYIGWSPREYAAFRATREYQSMRVALNRQFVAWVAAHYVGHKILPEPPEPSAVARERYERTVDTFATRLMFDAGFAPMPPLAHAMLFVSLEDRAQASPDAALCRATQIVWRGWQLSASRSSAAPLRELGDSVAQYMAPQRDDLERLRSGSQCASLSAE